MVGTFHGYVSHNQMVNGFGGCHHFGEPPYRNVKIMISVLQFWILKCKNSLNSLYLLYMRMMRMGHNPDINSSCSEGCSSPHQPRVTEMPCFPGSSENPYWDWWSTWPTPWQSSLSVGRSPVKISIYTFWVNYNDLTATSLESWLVREIIPKWP